MEIMGVVRKWHLTAHIQECFSKFNLNFIEGARQVEGEILETLWSRMDEIAGLVQSMSIAHHQETVDEHMNDNNWQKTIQMGRYLYSFCSQIVLTSCQAESLCRKWNWAREGLSETKAAFDQLTAYLEPSLVAEWTAQEWIAMETCGDALRIYEVTSEKCKRCIALLLRFCWHMEWSTNIVGNMIQIVGNRGSPRKPLWSHFTSHRRVWDWEITVCCPSHWLASGNLFEW